MIKDTSEWVPASCMLPTVERPLRENAFADLFASSLAGVERTSSETARLVLAPESFVRARDLAARESSCCSFFTFDFREIDGAAVMSVTVPAARVPVLDALVASARRAAAFDPSSS